MDCYKKGNDLHKLDYFIYKAENFEILGRAKEGIKVLEEGEKILQDIIHKENFSIFQRKIDLQQEKHLSEIEILKPGIIVEKDDYNDIVKKQKKPIVKKNKGNKITKTNKVDEVNKVKANKPDVKPLS